jgi:ATP-dependent DNA helicase RecG
MDGFRSGSIDLLVGTTVVEVGVHVPRATMMIIEHPERFGLAQLHQLRGRVGRGSERGRCFLMLSKNTTEEAVTRMKTITANHNGFEIAKKDLKLRGPGTFMGMKQSGMGEVDVSEMINEPELLLKAKEGAQRLMDDDPELMNPENASLKILVEALLARPLDL